MLNDGIIEKQGAPGDVLKDIDIKSIEMATDKEDEEKVFLEYSSRYKYSILLIVFVKQAERIYSL